jgi:hypothetical protein
MAERDPGAADAPTHPDVDHASAGAARDRASLPGAPRWVKAAAVIGVVIVLLVVAMLLIGGGDHGPGRHLGGTSSPTDARQGTTPLDRGSEEHVPPAGGH